jgi:hypothetical protein
MRRFKGRVFLTLFWAMNKKILSTIAGVEDFSVAENFCFYYYVGEPN